MPPGTRIRVEAVVNGLLGVIPLWRAAIVVEPVIDLNGANVRDAAPVSLMLIPVISRLQHPAMIGTIEIVTRRTVGYGEYLGIITIERGGLRSCIKRKQLGKPNYEDNAHEDITEAAWDTFHKRLPPCEEIDDTMCNPSLVYLKDIDGAKQHRYRRCEGKELRYEKAILSN